MLLRKMTIKCFLSEHESRRPVLQSSGGPRQPARPGPVRVEPEGEDTRAQRPRDEPGGGAWAAQGAARGGALPQSPSGPGNPRVSERLAVRQSVILRQPRVMAEGVGGGQRPHLFTLMLRRHIGAIVGGENKRTRVLSKKVFGWNVLLLLLFCYLLWLWHAGVLMLLTLKKKKIVLLLSSVSCCNWKRRIDLFSSGFPKHVKPK